MWFNAIDFSSKNLGSSIKSSISSGTGQFTSMRKLRNLISAFIAEFLHLTSGGSEDITML